MIKFSLVFLVLAVWNLAQGAPLYPFDDIVAAANAGNWDQLNKLLAQNFGKDGWKDISVGGVKDLKPPQGGHVYGESEYTVHSSSDINGLRSEKSAGHKVINDDGQVKEFDFQPPPQSEVLKKFGFDLSDFKTPTTRL